MRLPGVSFFKKIVDLQFANFTGSKLSSKITNFTA